MGRLMMQNHVMLTDAIRIARRRKKLTQAGLADLAGVAERSVWMLEQGRGNLATLLSVMEALGLSLRCSGVEAGLPLPELLAALRERSVLSLAELSRRVEAAPATIRSMGLGGSGRVDVLLKILAVLDADACLESRAAEQESKNSRSN